MARRLTAGLAVIACHAACMLSVPSAHAGLFDDDEARTRIETLRRDVGDLGKRLEASTTAASNTTRSQLELANQIEQLKGDLAKLRGQLEVLTYDLEATQKRQKDFYVDLDNRLRKFESAAAATDSKAAEANAAPQRDPAAEMRDFETALTLFKGSRYKEAQAAFEGFIKTYTGSAMSPSAHYWAASALYQLRDFQKAAEVFAKVPATWPADAKAPEALLGQANSHRDLGDVKSARKTLEVLVEKYPASAAAQAARLRLQKK